MPYLSLQWFQVVTSRLPFSREQKETVGLSLHQWPVQAAVPRHPECSVWQSWAFHAWVTWLNGGNQMLFPEWSPRQPPPPPGVSSLGPTASEDWMAGPKLLFYQLLCGLWGWNTISISLDWQPPPQRHHHASGQYCRIPSGKQVLSFRNHTQKCHLVNDRPPFPTPSLRFLNSRKMCAHILIFSAFMCSCLFVFLYCIFMKSSALLRGEGADCKSEPCV